MKPPAPGAAVALRARLGEMPECWLEACCGQCGSHTYIPIKLLARNYGEGMPIGAILGRLSCKRCLDRRNSIPNRAHSDYLRYIKFDFCVDLVEE